MQQHPLLVQLATYKKLLNKKVISIVIIAHVYEPRGHRNNSQLQCSDAERFSIEEFNEIYQGIVLSGCYVHRVFFNEIDFIEDYLRQPSCYRNTLIYNLARNGYGDNKKTLIPSFCELTGLQYSTSSSLSCALCRNKFYFSSLLTAAGIPVPKTRRIDDLINHTQDGSLFCDTVIAKPCSESASQGISGNNIIKYSYEAIKTYEGKDYVLQEYIDGIECEVPIIAFPDNVIALPPVGIQLGNKHIMDEDASSNYEYSFFPLAQLYSNDKITEIMDYAVRAFRTLGMEVYGRIDFRISKDGTPYVFDVSTTPYTILHSSFAYAFELLGFDYPSVYEAIIVAANARRSSSNG